MTASRLDTAATRTVRLSGWVRSRWHAVLLAVVPSTLFLAAGWARRWTADDAFINYRVIKQMQAGNGPVYNVGQRVEATTSTLWAGVLLVGNVLSPLRLEWNAILLGLALGAFGMVAGIAGALRLARLRDRDASPGDDGRSDHRRVDLVVPLGALVYLAVPATWDWATGGLENGLSLAWIGASFWAVTALVDPASWPPPASPGDPVTPSRRRVWATAFLVGLGVVVRPDFAVFSVAFAVPVAATTWRRHRLRTLLGAGAAALALPVAVQVFRMGYYGQLLPNPIYAKEGGRSWWSQGWRYLANFTGPYVLVVPVVVVVVWLAVSWRPEGKPRMGLVSWRLVVAATVLGALAHTVGIVRAGGDHMHARLLLPGWFALLLPVFAVPVDQLHLDDGPSRARWRPALRLAGIAIVLVWGVMAASSWRASPGSLVGGDWDGPGGPGDDRIVDAREITARLTGTEHRIVVEDMHSGLPSLADALRGRRLPPGYYQDLAGGVAPLPIAASVGRAVVPVSAAGADGYAAPLDMWVYDAFGLGDTIVARVTLDHRGTPGHEKTLAAAWVAALYVDPSVELDVDTFMPATPLGVEISGVDLPVDQQQADFDADRRAAQEALRCGALAELLERTRQPLTIARFLDNLTGAISLDGFRFPIDPQQARAEFCD